MFDGILLINKEKGWTSHDVVAKVRGILKQQAARKVKVGHTGTLDPLATGLMIVVVGSYCKRAQEFSKMDKTYEVTMRLGQTSTTGDEEGEKTTINSQIPPDHTVFDALEQFIGEIQQVPPAFSAIKVAGKKAYELAREGKEVKLEPRKVTIYEISDRAHAYPYVHFTTRVASGTYIRSLVEDIGGALGTGAYMSDLRRTSVGDFELTNAYNIDSFTNKSLTELLIKVAV